MAIAVGNQGSVTVWTSVGSSWLTVAEMGNWTISGPGLNMVDASAFGDERGRQKPGMRSPQTLTFDGYYDQTSTAQNFLQTWLSSGTPIYASTKTGPPCHLRLWANTDTALEQCGFWGLTSTTSLSVKTYVTGLEVGQEKDGVQSVAFTLAVTGANFVWSSST